MIQAACGRGSAKTHRRGRAHLFVPATVLVLACAIGSAPAHDFWLEPSTFTPAPGAVITVTLRVGVPFRGDPVPRNDRSIRRFVLLERRGATPIDGLAGSDPAGRVTLGDAGAALIGYMGTPSPNVVDAETFEAYLRDKGLDDAVEARARAHATREPAVELFSRCAKAVVRVGGSGDVAPDSPLGCRFELFAERIAGSPAEGPSVFRAYFDGKPAARIKVVASSRASSKAIEARTGPDGRALLALAAPGEWVVNAVHMSPAAANSGAEWESIWASIALSMPDMPLSQGRAATTRLISLESSQRLR